GEGLLVLVVVAFDQIGATDDFAEPDPELGLHRRDRQVTAVARRVDAVASEPTSQAPLRRALKAVRSETVRVVGHRDGEARSAPGLLSLQQRSEDVDYRVQRPAREVRD